MEVFIRDEETKWDISYSLADSNNSLDCKDHKPIIVKSLDQHDAEVRKQERQDIFMELNELKNYFDKRFNDFENNYEDETFSNIDMSNCYLDASSNLEGILEKLNEMKGEER